MENQFYCEFLINIVRNNITKLIELFFYVVVTYLMLDEFYDAVSTSFYSPFP